MAKDISLTPAPLAGKVLNLSHWSGLLLFLSTLFLAIFFFDREWNPSSLTRAIGVYALVNDHEFKIDSYRHLSMDHSKIGDHYFVEKAPLSYLPIVPVYSLIFPLLDKTAQSRPEPVVFHLFQILRIGAILTGGLAFVVLFFVTFQSAVQMNLEPAFAFRLLSLLFFSSFLFVYTEVFWGHLLGGLFLALSYQRITRDEYVMAGVFLGLSFLTEFPAVAVIPAILLYVAYRRPRLDLIKLGLGIFPFGLFLLSWNYAFTGSPWTPIYQFAATPGFAEVMSQSSGFRLPQWEALVGLLVGFRRGLLIHSPLFFSFLLFLPNYRIFLKRSVFLRVVFSEACLPWFYFFPILIFVSAYSYWDGGMCFGPRHLILPFCVLMFAFGPIITKRIHEAQFQLLRHGLILLLPINLLITFAAKVTRGIHLDESSSFPLIEYIFKDFFSLQWGKHHMLSWMLTPETNWIGGVVFTILSVITFLAARPALERCTTVE